MSVYLLTHHCSLELVAASSSGYKSSRTEQPDGDEHEAGADAIGPASADMVLDVDEDDGDGEKRAADAYQEAAVVEEKVDSGMLVELVGRC